MFETNSELMGKKSMIQQPQNRKQNKLFLQF